MISSGQCETRRRDKPCVISQASLPWKLLTEMAETQCRHVDWCRHETLCCVQPLRCWVKFIYHSTTQSVLTSRIWFHEGDEQIENTSCSWEENLGERKVRVWGRLLLPSIPFHITEILNYKYITFKHQCRLGLTEIISLLWNLGEPAALTPLKNRTETKDKNLPSHLPEETKTTEII